MARVLGSYPIGRWFKSYCRYHKWPVGQEVKTSPFHGGIMGSIPVRVTIQHSRKHRRYVVSEFFYTFGFMYNNKFFTFKPFYGIIKGEIAHYV